MGRFPESYVYQNYRYAQLYVLKWKLNIFVIALLFLIAVLIALAIQSGYAASKLNDYQFFQSLLIESAAGIGMFLVTPVFMALGKLLKGWLILITIIISTISCFLAYHSKGITQSLLIELAVGLLLLTALEIYFKNYIKHIKKTADEGSKVKDSIDNTEKEMDEFRIGHGFPLLPEDDDLGN